jgi:hypothetical protein
MSAPRVTADRIEIETLRGEFTERVYEVRYLDTTPLAGSAGLPGSARGPLRPQPGSEPRRDSTPAWPWPPTTDALPAAPASHRVLLGNYQVRVLEVAIEPGTREPEQTHQAASVMIVDEPARIRYYVGDTVQYESPPGTGSPAQVRVKVRGRDKALEPHRRLVTFPSPLRSPPDRPIRRRTRR